LWARYFSASGNHAAAVRYARHALAEANSPRQPLALVAAHRLLGRLDTESGAFASASRHFHSAIELADACGAPYERALTLLAQAECARGDADSTVEVHLTEARAICVALGAAPALARIEAMAARA
jgi:hypothetical protein